MSKHNSIALFPGSFDPITYGHLDVIERASNIFDELIVCVADNKPKNCLLDLDERVRVIKNHVKKINDSISVKSFNGLLVDFAKINKVGVIIRGLRAISDFEYEFQMALMNRKISKNKIETMFLMPSEKYTYLSSSLVKEISRLGGDVNQFIPNDAEILIKSKFG